MRVPSVRERPARAAVDNSLAGEAGDTEESGRLGIIVGAVRFTCHETPFDSVYLGTWLAVCASPWFRVAMWETLVV